MQTYKRRAKKKKKEKGEEKEEEESKEKQDYVWILPSLMSPPMIPFIVLPSGCRYIGTFDHHIRAYVDLSIVDFDSTLPPSFSASSS